MVSELLLVDAVLVLDLYYNVTRHVTMFLNSNYSMVPFDIPLGRCCQFYMHNFALSFAGDLPSQKASNSIVVARRGDFQKSTKATLDSLEFVGLL